MKNTNPKDSLNPFMKTFITIIVPTKIFIPILRRLIKRKGPRKFRNTIAHGNKNEEDIGKLKTTLKELTKKINII